MQRHREQTAHLQAALLHSWLVRAQIPTAQQGSNPFAAVATTGAAQG